MNQPKDIPTGTGAAGARDTDLLRLIVEHIPNMIFVKEAENLSFVLLNAAGEALLGYDREDMLGKNDYDFFPEDQADFFTSKDRSVFDADSDSVMDIRREPIDTKELGRRWLHTKKVPIVREDGEPLYLLGVSEDITELVETEDRLRIYEQFLVEAPIGLCLYESEGPGEYKCLAMNKALAAINGRPVEDHIGRRLEEISPLMSSTLIPIWDIVMETGDTRHGEVSGPDPRRPDETAWWLTSYCRLTAPNEDRHFIGGAVQDVTALKRAEANLRQALAENRDLTEFAYMASHDLKAPIRNMAHLAEQLREEFEDEQLPGDTERYLDELESNARRSQSMINALLQLARVQIEGGETTALVDPNVVLDNACRDLSAEMEASGATVERDPLPDVHADGDQLEKVFSNLLSNAIRHARTDIPPHIVVSCSEDDSKVTFAVSDNGMGIPRDQQDRAFQMFTRFHTADDSESAGIGLALVRRIVERHGGCVSLESRPAQGTTVSFSIPKRHRT